MRDRPCDRAGMTKIAKSTKSLRSLPAKPSSARSRMRTSRPTRSKLRMWGNAVAGLVTGRRDPRQVLLRPVGIGGIPIFTSERVRIGGECASSGLARASQPGSTTSSSASVQRSSRTPGQNRGMAAIGTG